MINLQIRLLNNHIKILKVEGHADFFPMDEIQEGNGAITHKKVTRKESMGSVPCAAVSVLCKSFIESIALYATQRKETVETFMKVCAPKEGSLEVELVVPENDLLHVHRFAIEQMLIIGIQTVAKEYPFDIKLRIGK